MKKEKQNNRPINRSESKQINRGLRGPLRRAFRTLVGQAFRQTDGPTSVPSNTFLVGLEAHMAGHESLRSKAGILQRDMSINNFMINEKNPSWRAFLIDLDLAIKEQRQRASGAKEMTDTRPFMAIRVLLGQ
jgi:hypothetical protein